MIQRRFRIKDGVLLETKEVRIEDRTELFKYNPLVRGGIPVPYSWAS